VIKLATDLELKTIFTLDDGVSIEVDCEIDVSGASSQKVLVTNPAGTVTSHNAVQGADNNKVKFNKTSSMFTSAGIYKAKALIDFGGGVVQQGAVDRFRIKESWAVT
jgi:hypothetical protein